MYISWEIHIPSPPLSESYIFHKSTTNNMYILQVLKARENFKEVCCSGIANIFFGILVVSGSKKVNFKLPSFSVAFTPSLPPFPFPFLIFPFLFSLLSPSLFPFPSQLFPFFFIFSPKKPNKGGGDQKNLHPCRRIYTIQGYL